MIQPNVSRRPLQQNTTLVRAEYNDGQSGRPGMTRINTLFVCSRNRWRSPTAERVFRNDTRLSVRSCGLSSKSSRTLRADDLIWADVVFVMEPKHRSRILGEFRNALGGTPLHVLDIPDDYQFMDPELVAMLKERVAEFLLARQDDIETDE